MATDTPGTVEERVAAGAATTVEPSLVWLVQALSIVREFATVNESYCPSTLAALHWAERAVQRIAELEAENAGLKLRLSLIDANRRGVCRS